MLNDLRQENSNLKAKIDLELSARPSSQKYVSDLIDRMVDLQNRNDSLERENHSLNALVKNYEQKYNPVLSGQKAEVEDEE